MAHLKRILLLLGMLILVASAAMGQSDVLTPDPRLNKPAMKQPRYTEDPASWTRYTVKGGEFSVKLPTVPAMTTAEGYLTRVQKRRPERVLKTSFQGVVYRIEIFENTEPRQSLAEFVRDQNTGSAYDLTTERNITVDVFHGKEYRLQNQTVPGIVQLFATERRLYKFTATGAGAEHAGVKEFFSSIVLGQNPGGTAIDDRPGMALEADEGHRIYLGNEVDAKPRLLNKPEPLYPEKARIARTVGVVVLRVVFHKSGEVINIQVIEGLPDGLTDAAIDAARRIKFVPAHKDGKPVSMRMQLEYNFNL